MEGRKITRSEQGCISNCIHKHWGDPKNTEDPEVRDQQYERCLDDCRVCG